MDADTRRFDFEKETSQIIGCAFDVLNELGHGLLEKPYENALAIDFRHKQIPFVQQQRFEVTYRSEKVGEYIPDLIAFNTIIIDTKVIDRITDHELGQMMNYLRITKLPVGLILNFKRSKLEWKRVAVTH